MSMFLSTQGRSQPDVCTEHKQCYLARNISAKISFFLIRTISSILEQKSIVLQCFFRLTAVKTGRVTRVPSRRRRPSKGAWFFSTMA